MPLIGDIGQRQQQHCGRQLRDLVAPGIGVPDAHRAVRIGRFQICVAGAFGLGQDPGQQREQPRVRQGRVAEPAQCLPCDVVRGQAERGVEGAIGRYDDLMRVHHHQWLVHGIDDGLRIGARRPGIQLGLLQPRHVGEHDHRALDRIGLGPVRHNGAQIPGA